MRRSSVARPRVSVTLPDGRSASRETERDYTHALVHRSPLDGGWKVVSWHQGLANGRQAMLRHQREVAQHPYRADRETGWAVVAGSIHLIAVDGSRPAGFELES